MLGTHPKISPSLSWGRKFRLKPGEEVIEKRENGRGERI